MKFIRLANPSAPTALNHIAHNLGEPRETDDDDEEPQQQQPARTCKEWQWPLLIHRQNVDYDTSEGVILREERVDDYY